MLEEYGQIRAVAPLIRENVAALEKEMLKYEQLDCNLIHYFAPGIYMREVTMPAGALVIGHYHKTSNINLCLKGQLDLIGEGGEVITITAPFIAMSKPGRKIAYIIEDTVWVNIFNINETDLDKIEEKLFLKSEAYIEYEKHHNTKGQVICLH